MTTADPDRFKTRRDPKYGTAVAFDPKAKPVAWMTRADFFDWIWSMPEAQVSEALGIDTYLLCPLYAINRPNPGHWYRLRKGLNAPRDKLDPSLPETAGVPLVKFEQFPDGIARIPELRPSMRLGGSDRSRPLYPREPGEGPPAVLAAAASGQPCRLWCSGLVGPLPPFTVRELRAFIWEADPRRSDVVWSLYGLTRREAAKLAKREGVQVPHPAWWKATELSSDLPRPDGSRARRLSPARLDTVVDISPAAMTPIRAEVADDLAVEREAQERRKASMRAARDRMAVRLERSLTTIAKRVEDGEAGNLACSAEGVNRIAFKVELRRRLRIAFAEEANGDEAADNLTGYLMRGQADHVGKLLVGYVCRPRDPRGDPAAVSAEQRYSAEVVTLSSVLGLARWTVAAEHVAEAVRESGLDLPASVLCAAPAVEGAGTD